MKRKAIPTKIRKQVYEKYKGHCAYCGKEIEYKDMQIDHLIPIRAANHKQATPDEVETFNNYVCSCRMCNYYKRGRNINSMRKDLEKIHKKLETSYMYRLAKRYGMIEETPHKIEYYFEKEHINANT